MRSKEVIMGEAVKLRMGGDVIHDPVSLSILEVLLDIRNQLDYFQRMKEKGY